MASPASSVVASSPLPAASPAPPAGDPLAADDGSSDLLTTAQKEQIERVLREVGGNKAAAAKRLGVSRRSLYRWLDRLDVKP
jgi:transcriptional regulator with PAS, ATPase and Fis domain